jgi:hypothetical protein
MSWYESNSEGTHSQVVGMNCDRYSSILEYYNNYDELMRTRKLFGFSKDRIQVLVDSQCVGACALFAKLAELDDFGTVIGVGISTFGATASGISADLDGLECQRRAMKIEDSVPAEMLINHMPLIGQNLVIPLTRLVIPVELVVTTTIPAGTARPDFKEGAWYSGLQLYSAATNLFDRGTGEYNPGCSPCSDDGFSTGWAFFFIFLGLLLLPCIGGLGYIVKQNGCNLGEYSMMCYRACGKCKECCMSCVGSRWERSYGSLSGDPSDGMPSQSCCAGFDWRSYIPGMKGSALQEQYSDLNTTAETIPSSSINEYSPAMTVESRVEVAPLSPAETEEKTANL